LGKINGVAKSMDAQSMAPINGVKSMGSDSIEMIEITGVKISIKARNSLCVIRAFLF
jgi:hypothetical protein